VLLTHSCQITFADLHVVGKLVLKACLSARTYAVLLEVKAMSVTNPYWSRALLICFCVAIAALSFWSTLKLMDQSGARSSWSDPVVTALPAGTAQTNLPELPSLPDSRFSWLGILGINAQVIAGVPAVSAHPILRLVALQDGVHTLAVRVNGLVKNERYRITAWIKPQAGATFEIAARDQADKDNGPNNARAFFDLASGKVLSVHGNGKPGIEQVGDWLTVWLDLLTTDGQFVVNFYVCDGDAESYTGDGRLGIILGGTAAD
jgi:hypothetical protein